MLKAKSPSSAMSRHFMNIRYNSQKKTEPAQRSQVLVESGIEAVLPENAEMQAWHRQYGENHAGRLAFDLEILDRFVMPGSKILEIGSVPLLFSLAALRSGFNIIGCDIAPERYTQAIKQNGLDIRKCNIEYERLPFEDNSFDAVVFNEIFEHLRINPLFTLRQVYRVMKPGAILMLSSPNLRSIGGLINFLRHNKAYSCSADLFTEYQKLEALGHMGHVREYTTTEVLEFLSKLGFSVDTVLYRGSYRTFSRRAITALMPSLKPFVSYIATKQL